MLSRTWDLVFLCGFAVYVVIRGVYERRARGFATAIDRRDGRERALLALVFVGSLLLPAVYLFTPWLAFADYRLPGFAPWCGAPILAAALWLFRRSHADLGPNWSVTPRLRVGHELVTHGVYRSIRHPMYAAILLFGLGQGLLLQNWLAGWSALVSFVPLYRFRTPREEAMMREGFGEAYHDYQRRTGRLLPRWRRTVD